MAGGIPNKWGDYQPIGNVIEGTRFIAFKVPLHKHLTAALPRDEQFTPMDLLEKLEEKGIKLGLVIDLTNTKRYYSSQDLVQRDVKYAKIFTEGHVVPSNKVISKFFHKVDQFLSDSSNEETYIGVHCTHGVNRTGYLLCRYMINKLDFEPDIALELCAAARGHPIHRENYIEDLKRGKKSDIPEYIESEENDDSRGRSPRKWQRRKNHHWHDRHGQKNQPRLDLHSNNSKRNSDERPFHRQHVGSVRDYPSSRQKTRDAGWGSSLQSSVGGGKSYGYNHNQTQQWSGHNDHSSGQSDRSGEWRGRNEHVDSWQGESVGRSQHRHTEAQHGNWNGYNEERWGGWQRSGHRNQGKAGHRSRHNDNDDNSGWAW